MIIRLKQFEKEFPFSKSFNFLVFLLKYGFKIRTVKELKNNLALSFECFIHVDRFYGISFHFIQFFKQYIRWVVFKNSILLKSRDKPQKIK